MSRVAMSYEVIDDVARAGDLARARRPSSRSPPWCRWTRSEGAKRSISRAHWRVTLIGQTTSVGPNASAPNCSRSEASIAIACTVLPSPMSSARIAPIPRSPSSRSQPWPRSWNGNSGWVIAAGVASGSKCRSSPPSSSALSASSSDDLAELEPGVLELDARDRADEVDHGSLAAALEEQQRLLDLGAPQCVPAPADADQRLLRRRELDQLLLGERRVADRELPVEAGECVGREQAARARADARRGEVDAEAARRVDPVPRQQHRHAELLEARNRVRSTKRTSSSASSIRVGSAGSNASPPSARTGSIRPSCRCTATRGSAERRKPKTASPPSWSSEVGRASVGSSAAWSQSSSTTEDWSARRRSRGLVVGALVEAEAEQPGRARAALEAAVDPVGEPALERAEARVGRQLGLGRGEAVEEELGRARTVAHEAVAEPHPRRAQPVARDLIDGARVEVVDERVAVAVERVRAHRGQGGSDRVERLLDRLVDRRAPVGEPGAAAVLELRVEEPLRDRACGEVEDGERRPGRPAELERPAACRPARPISSASPTRRALAALPEAREVGDGGDSEVQIAGRERAVGAAREHGRAHILLPQDLERRALGERVGLDRLGCGHEPFRIRGSGGGHAGSDFAEPRMPRLRAQRRRAARLCVSQHERPPAERIELDQ